MATGSGEVPVVSEAAEGKGEGEGKVSAAVEEEEEGEVSVEAVTVEKEGEGAAVSEVVEKAPAKAGNRAEEESGGMITLKCRCSDGELFEVRAPSEMLSKILGEMVESGNADGVIPLTDIDSKTLKKLDKDRNLLICVIIAANFLSIRGLLKDTCQKVADTIKGKTPEEIREAFNLNNDLTDEDLKDISQKCECTDFSLNP
uniref:SKP1 component dimerisation domain-containing protein n=1 Tax=Oryza brachyantha TaxID=4533 RepID=J3MN56_ORYBR